MTFGDSLMRFDENLEKWIQNNHGLYLLFAVILGFVLAFGFLALVGNISMTSGIEIGTLVSGILVVTDLTAYGGKNEE
jgi:hypothetical protein